MSSSSRNSHYAKRGRVVSASRSTISQRAIASRPTWESVIAKSNLSSRIVPTPVSVIVPASTHPIVEESSQPVEIQIRASNHNYSRFIDDNLETIYAGQFHTSSGSIILFIHPSLLLKNINHRFRELPELRNWNRQEKSLWLYGLTLTGKSAFSKTLYTNPIFVTDFEDLKKIKPEHNGILFDDMNFVELGYSRESMIKLTDIEAPRTISSHQDSESEVPVASSSRDPISSPSSSCRPITASTTPPSRFAAHKRPALPKKTGSESSVTITDDSSPLTPPELDVHYPARLLPSHHQLLRLAAFCRPSSSIRRFTFGSLSGQYRIPKYSPSNPGPIRLNPPVSAPFELPITQSTHNLTAALARSTFTPYEYSRKLKALEQLT
ncbi:hypothetical protein AYI69_g3899, partial [Smittium culicis]